MCPPCRALPPCPPRALFWLNFLRPKKFEADRRRRRNRKESPTCNYRLRLLPSHSPFLEAIRPSFYHFFFSRARLHFFKFKSLRSSVMARWTRTVAQREVGSGEGGSRCRRFVACDRLGGIQVTAGLAKAHDFATPSWRVLCAGFTASRSSWSASSSLRFLLPTSSRRAVPAERFIESKNSCETKPTQHHQLLSDISEKNKRIGKVFTECEENDSICTLPKVAGRETAGEAGSRSPNAHKLKH